jgi:DnaK suppressor protein
VNKTPYTEFRRQLEAQRAQLLDEVRRKIAAVEEGLGPVGQTKITDEEGLADAAAEVEVAMTMRENQELQEIDAALVRIDDGSYGSCADCGNDISQARLKATPSARRCLICQEKYEQSLARKVGA